MSWIAHRAEKKELLRQYLLSALFCYRVTVHTFRETLISWRILLSRLSFQSAAAD